MYPGMFHWIGALERRQKTRRFCMRLHWVLLVFCQLSFHPIVEDIQTLLWGCCSLFEVSSSDFWSWLYYLVWPVKFDHAVWSESEPKKQFEDAQFRPSMQHHISLNEKKDGTHQERLIYTWNSHENMSHVLHILGILTWNTWKASIRCIACRSCPTTNFKAATLFSSLASMRIGRNWPCHGHRP